MALTQSAAVWQPKIIQDQLRQLGSAARAASGPDPAEECEAPLSQADFEKQIASK
jgi:hypothetical protein